MGASVIVGLAGPAGVGKSSIARHLVERHGYVCKPFAGPIKQMILALGVPAEAVYGDRKGEPLEILGGRTARYAMQTLGTQWGRWLIDPEIWLRAWRASLPTGVPVVVDDVRFDNEALLIRALGGTVVEVRRRGVAYAAGHASERGLAEPADMMLANDGRLEDDLGAAADRLVGWIAALHR